MQKTQITLIAAVLLLLSGLVLSSCTNLTPLTPVAPNSSLLSGEQDYTVTYNYSDDGPIKLSANNIVLATGKRLILQPASSALGGKLRFISTGNVMKQEGDTQKAGQTVFTAIKPGKGKVQIIPTTTRANNRAIDLLVTVK